MMSGSLHTTGARPGRSMHAVVSPTSRCFPAQSHLKTLRHQPGHLARVRHLLPRALSADSPVSPDKEEADPVSVSIDNDTSTEYTIVTVQGANKAGLLMSVSGLFRDLGIDVTKAQVETTNGLVNDQFYVTDSSTGGKVTSEEDIAMLSSVLRNLASNRPGRALSRTEFENITARKKAVINNLMDTYTKSDVPSLQESIVNMPSTDTYTKSDVLSIQESIVNHVEYTLARSRYRFDDLEAYLATAHSLRDRLIEVWNDTQSHFREVNGKRVYYLSMEFLMGRSLLNALFNLDVKDQYNEALLELGYDLETVMSQEMDAALGNGGLGRLAACFLDSMATLDLPAWGYGIRYTYGMFRQNIKDGFQHEQPDYWLTFGNPWEIERLNVSYPICFYGHVSVHDEEGRQQFRWNAGEQVTAVAYDNPIPGFDTANTINLRLWAAKPDKEFDLEAFNTGDYVQAILAKQRAETLSSVLYPDDRTYEGKELRLKQQHFFVSATLQDVVRRFKETNGTDFSVFHEKVAFQLNDTHPTIAVPELMRLLMDENSLGWTESWEITTKVFGFTNHTVMPEALERWPVALLEKLLPRHMQIIYDINWRFLQQLRTLLGDDWDRIARMSIIEEGSQGDKVVRMAYLGVIAAHTVNGVAKIHSAIIQETVFAEFYAIWPEKFINITNGVTQRRWLAFCNPSLRQLISRSLGSEEWIKDLYKLEGLRPFAVDPAFLKEWAAVKRVAKVKAAAYLFDKTGITVSPDSMFDVQVKRIHEYKRQLLNVLGIIHRYKRIREMSDAEKATVVPRVVVIGGKAAPGYDMAKRIIKLVCSVADVVNADPLVGDVLKVVFMPDYNVSGAEMIIPASELSQHISTAGTEASGTSNMKFCMNGALTIGTMDGANVEIAGEIGEENMFIFGARKDEVAALRAGRKEYVPDERYTQVLAMIRGGTFGWADYFSPLINSLEGVAGGDYYLCANDFVPYIEMQDHVDEVYKDQATWNKMSIMSTAGSGMFSSDRTIREYVDKIWKCETTRVPIASNGSRPLPEDRTRA